MAITKKFDIIASDYLRIRDVGRGAMGAVYEALDLDDPSQKVAIKFIGQTGEISHDVLHRFQREATLMSQLYHPNIITFREFGILDDNSSSLEGGEVGYYIVMDLAKGRNLKEILARYGRDGLSLKFFFQLAEQLASALDYTHGKDIIHRDIKPQNIVVEYVSEEDEKIIAKVLDFGVASLGGARNFTGVEKQGFDDFAGTPLYLAPELTKLLDAKPDHRVDLYSMGCVLYEVLVGSPPFKGVNREELLKAHASKNATFIHEIRSDVPVVVSQLVHRLLAKHPDDRYQTGFSFLADLMQIKGLLESGQDTLVGGFAPGLIDSFKSVGTNQTLVGREYEYEQLTNFYNAVANDSARGRISLIAGDPGIGKSRLLQEMRNYFLDRKIRFISGSFTKHESKIPFNALASAFDEYLLKIIRTQPLEARKIQQRFKSMLGVFAHRIAEIIPGIRPYLVDIPEPNVEDERDFEDYSSFVKAFTDFTRCLMSDDQPVVFLFDNLHFADSKSLHLIDQFFTYNNTQRIYLILSYQRGMLGRNEMFEDFVTRISKLRRRFQRIEIETLDLNQTGQLIEGMFDDDEMELSSDLLNFIYKATAGNPSHIVERVRDYVLHGDIRKLPHMGSWITDFQSASKSNRTINNFDLILRRLVQYDELDRLIIESAAVVGLSFHSDILMMHDGITKAQVETVVNRACKEGLVELNTHDSVFSELGPALRFVHRSMREYIYDSISTERKHSIHLAIAKRMYELFGEFNTQLVFTLVHHLNCALKSGHSMSVYDLKFALTFNLKAADFASGQESFPSAARYYGNCKTILEDYLWDQATMKEKAHIFERYSLALMKQGNFKESLEVLKKILDMLFDMNGVDLPKQIFTTIINRYISIQMREGRYSQAFRWSKMALEKISGKSLDEKYGLFYDIVFYVYLLVDWAALKFKIGGTPIMNVLSRIHGKSKEKRQVDGFTTLNFLNLAHDACMGFDPKAAKIIHQIAYQNALTGQASLSELISFTQTRAEYFSRFGFRNTTKEIFKLTQKYAKNISVRQTAIAVARKILGYSLKRGNYYKGLEKFQKSDIFKYFAVPEDSVLDAQMRAINAYYMLLLGEGQRALNEVRRGLHLLSTRSELSPYLIMIIVYLKLLRGESNTLVVSAEAYLKKRELRTNKTEDPFLFLIRATIALVNGRFEEVNDYLKRSISKVLVSNHKARMSLFQMEFYAICILSFPKFYKYSTGKTVWRDKNFIEILKRLQTALEELSFDHVLVKRILHAVVKGMEGDAKFEPDLNAVIETCQKNNLDFLGVIALYLKGSLLHSYIDKNEGRDELIRSLELSRKLRYIGFSRIIEAKLERANFKFERRMGRGGLVRIASRFSEFPTTLSRDYPRKVMVLQGSKPKTYLLNASAKMFKYHYGGDNVHFISLGVNGEKVEYSLSGIHDHDALIDFLAPYTDIQNSMFLPCTSTPWSLDSSVPSTDISVFSIDKATDKMAAATTLESTSLNDSAFGTSEDTKIMDAGIEATEIHQNNSKDTNSTSSVGQHLKTAANKLSKEFFMCCLIPVFSRGENIGMFFVENIGELYQSNSQESRNEIDLWAAQVGYLLTVSEGSDQVVEVPSSSVRPVPYAKGDFYLEDCSWLHLWKSGKLRKDRESTWYLGLNFGNEYVIFYLQLLGEDWIRNSLSVQIWNHVMSLRLLKERKGSDRISVDELYKDIGFFIQNSEKVEFLKEVLLSFSVIDRAKQTVESGHFGASRPLVLGSENRVEPKNSAVLRFDKGGVLYFWRVNSSMADYLPLIVTRNVSKLEADSRHEEYLQLSEVFHYEVSRQAGNRELQNALERVVGNDLVPRYYVGAVMKSSDDDLEQAAEGFDEVG